LRSQIRPHGGILGRCSQCQRPAPGYDRLPERLWLFVPLWGIPTYFRYAPRRVECAEHGIVVEHIPWSDGKRPVTCAMMGFLARWARRLSWRETAQVFQTSWEAVYRSVEWFVQWGLAHRELQGVESIGVDEIHWGHGLRADNFLTVVYQIDAHCRRLLWVGERRSEATLRRGLQALGPEVIQGLRFVCSDMWKPYLQVIAAQAGQALHVLDRFHITTHLNQAVDQVRREESSRLRAAGKAMAQRLKHMRWPLLRRGSRVRGRARQKLDALLARGISATSALTVTRTNAMSPKMLPKRRGRILAGDRRCDHPGSDRSDRCRQCCARLVHPELPQLHRPQCIRHEKNDDHANAEQRVKE
jgi:transposase